MSFTDRKPFVVTAGNVATFQRLKQNYYCALCGHQFTEGDIARWIYANSTPHSPGNFFACSRCDDAPDASLIQRGIESYGQAVALAKRWGIYGPDWAKD